MFLTLNFPLPPGCLTPVHDCYFFLGFWSSDWGWTCISSFSSNAYTKPSDSSSTPACFLAPLIHSIAASRSHPLLSCVWWGVSLLPMSLTWPWAPQGLGPHHTPTLAWSSQSAPRMLVAPNQCTHHKMHSESFISSDPYSGLESFGLPQRLQFPFDCCVFLSESNHVDQFWLIDKSLKLLLIYSFHLRSLHFFLWVLVL